MENNCQMTDQRKEDEQKSSTGSEQDRKGCEERPVRYSNYSTLFGNRYWD